MCGIAGVFSASEPRTPLSAMVGFLRHRGPDDTGIADLEGAHGGTFGAFGHRRLAVLDLSSGGHQPKFSADGRLCMTYNGEIYNYRELRADLAQSGVVFRTESDSEVILAGWQARGPAFLRELRGMFALAIWDSEKERGFLVRDVFGIKPLYVAEAQGDVLFASEVRALVSTGRIPRTLSADAVRSYLSTGSVAEPLTIIDGVRAIPPGCVVEVVHRNGAFALGATSRFTTVFHETDPADRDQRSHVRQIREALRESVGYHLVSDVPVGVFLSGGIDSSAVAGLASEVAKGSIESFTVIFDEADYSEAEPARAAAERFGTRHHEVLLSGKDLLNALPDVFSAMDQPTLDGLNTFVVSRAVKSFGLKVVLSGLGGDELFGGYPSFQRARYVAPLWKLPRTLRRIAAIGADPFDNRVSRMSVLLRQDTPARGAYKASRTLFGDRHVGRLMSVPSSRSESDNAFDAADYRDLTLMQQVSLHELTGYMRNTLLRDSDVFSMAHGLELRVPLVDSGVAHVAQQAARALNLTRGSIKPMLIDAVRDLLSPEIIARPKKGFTLPFETWMRREMFPEVNSVLTARSAGDVSLDANEVSNVWQGFLSRRPGVNWSRPWALYTLMRWARQNDVTYSPAAAPLSLAG